MLNCHNMHYMTINHRILSILAFYRLFKCYLLNVSRTSAIRRIYCPSYLSTLIWSKVQIGGQWKIMFRMTVKRKYVIYIITVNKYKKQHLLQVYGYCTIYVFFCRIKKLKFMVVYWFFWKIQKSIAYFLFISCRELLPNLILVSDNF